MKNFYTPKPWRYLSGSRSVWSADGKRAIFQVHGPRKRCDPHREGNGLLGAAAPEMYEALKRQHENILRWQETGEPASAEESKSITDQIAAAIAKAEGHTIALLKDAAELAAFALFLAGAWTIWSVLPA